MITFDRNTQEEDALAVASEVAGPGNAQAALELLGDVESRPLFVSFAADALRMGTKQGLKSALDLTRAFWRRTIETFWIPLGVGDAEHDALCLATLTGGMPIRTLSDPAWCGLGVPQANPGLRENLSRMYALDSSRPQEGPRIRPLQPSFAGEVFVLDRLQGAVELGHDPSKGLLRAAWRHSPHDVSGFVQRAFSDLPDHPVMELLLEAGPEPGDVDANEIWSGCLRTCVASRLAVGNQGLALGTFQSLLRLAEEIRTDEILSDAAFTAATLITHLRQQEQYELAVRTLQDLVQAFHKLYQRPAQAAVMPPVTQHRLSILNLGARVEPLLEEFLGSGPTWPGSLGAAFQVVFSIHESLPSRKARIEFLHLLGDVVRPFASAIRQENSPPGAILLWSLPTLIDAACHAAEVDLHLSGLMALKHMAASFEAAKRGDTETSFAEAKAACDRLSADEMSDEVSDKVGSSLLSLSVHLHQTGYLAEARSLLATLFGGEEAISSRQTIADALGDEATPELVDQLHLVASGRSALPPIDPPEGPSADS